MEQDSLYRSGMVKPCQEMYSFGKKLNSVCILQLMLDHKISFDFREEEGERQTVAVCVLLLYCHPSGHPRVQRTIVLVLSCLGKRMFKCALLSYGG
jgi:hypothetical protein